MVCEALVAVWGNLVDVWGVLGGVGVSMDRPEKFSCV